MKLQSVCNLSICKVPGLYMQALYYVWSHAVPLRLQRPRGDSPSLPSAVPETASAEPASRSEAFQSSFLEAPAQSVVMTEATAACSSGQGLYFWKFWCFNSQNWHLLPACSSHMRACQDVCCGLHGATK